MLLNYSEVFFLGIFLEKIKSCVRYIFASLFFKSKREHLSNQGKCFSFHFKSFSRPRKNKFLEFQIFKFHNVIMPKHKTRNTFYKYNFKSEHSLLMKFGQFMSHYKRKNLIQKFCKNCSLKTSSRPFCVCKELNTASIGK